MPRQGRCGSGSAGSAPPSSTSTAAAWGAAFCWGLEFLVAGDIINTVAVEPTYRSVGVLSVIVLIRPFLSFTLEVEMTGRWPWQGKGR
jgi:uncharacterized membrane protein